MKINFKKNALRLLAAVALFIAGFLLYHHEAALYGLAQAKGQVIVLWEAQDNDVFLNDPAFPDSLKERLRLIAEIKRYAIDSLGIDESDSYEKMFDQKGNPLLWTVTACRPFALEAKEWEFPIAGRFSYKGFFDKDKLKLEAEALQKEGWDVRTGQINAWSTLGWLNDPVLSNFLEMGDGDLADLIIHELTHGTLYVKNAVDYNENLATFVGEYGAIRFLKYKHGSNSEVMTSYIDIKHDRDLFTKGILQGAKSLDSLYKSFDVSMPDSLKLLRKEEKIRSVVQTISELPFLNQKYKARFKSFRPNNAYFMSYIRYNIKQNEFAKEFKEDFGEDFPKYLAYLKEKYPSM